MILYNVTLSIDHLVEKQFLDWLRNKHIQEVLETGCFKSARLAKLTSHSQQDSTNYAVQYLAESQEFLDEYFSKYSGQLQAEGIKLFGDKLQSFRTELEVIEDFYPNRS